MVRFESHSAHGHRDVHVVSAWLIVRDLLPSLIPSTTVGGNDETVVCFPLTAFWSAYLIMDGVQLQEMAEGDWSETRVKSTRTAVNGQDCEEGPA